MIYSLESVKFHPWSKIVGNYSRTCVGISPWFNRAGVVTTGIPEKELREFEQKMGYKEGTLSSDSPFLDTYQVKLRDGKARIDTSTPEGEFAYRFLCHHPLVAKDAQSKQPKHEYVLRNEDAEAVTANLKNKRKLEAFAEYKKMTTEDMRKALRILGRKSDTMSNELVESTLYTIIDEDSELFMNKWVNNAIKDYEFILESAVSAGVLVKNRSTYKYGTDSIGTSKEDALAYLKDKANADLLNAIQAETKAKLSI